MGEQFHYILKNNQIQSVSINNAELFLRKLFFQFQCRRQGVKVSACRIWIVIHRFFEENEYLIDKFAFQILYEILECSKYAKIGQSVVAEALNLIIKIVKQNLALLSKPSQDRKFGPLINPTIHQLQNYLFNQLECPDEFYVESCKSIFNSTIEKSDLHQWFDEWKR